jgi:hypothetical protein
MLTGSDDCPLQKKLQPGSPRCKKCKFYKGSLSDEVNIECKLDYSREIISNMVASTNIGSHPDDIAFMIIYYLVDKKIIDGKDK